MAGFLQAVGGASPQIMGVMDRVNQMGEREQRMRFAEEQNEREKLKFQYQQEALDQEKQLGEQPFLLDHFAQGPAGEYPTFLKTFMDFGKQNGFVEEAGGVPFIRRKNLPMLADQLKFGTEGGKMALQSLLQDSTNKVASLLQAKQNPKLKPEQAAAVDQQLQAAMDERSQLVMANDPKLWEADRARKMQQAQHVEEQKRRVAVENLKQRGLLQREQLRQRRMAVTQGKGSLTHETALKQINDMYDEDEAKKIKKAYFKLIGPGSNLSPSEAMDMITTSGEVQATGTGVGVPKVSERSWLWTGGPQPE